MIVSGSAPILQPRETLSPLLSPINTIPLTVRPEAFTPKVRGLRDTTYLNS